MLSGMQAQGLERRRFRSGHAFLAGMKIAAEWFYRVNERANRYLNAKQIISIEANEPKLVIATCTYMCDLWS